MENQSINILIANAKQELANLINNSLMPPILWTYILKDILAEAETLAAQQLQLELQAQKQGPKEQVEE